MDKKVIDYATNHKEFEKVMVNFPGMDLLEEIQDLNPGVIPQPGVLPCFYPHLCGLRKEINSKLKVSTGIDLIPQSGQNFHLKVTLKNMNLGFGNYFNLKVAFTPHDYVTLNSSGTVAVPNVMNGTSRAVTFSLHAVHSAQAQSNGDSNPTEHIGDIRITGSFECLPWVNINYPVWINITPL